MPTRLPDRADRARVDVHKLGKKQYVLASDRDFSLYIFRPKK
jgi:hypothetical protein